MKKIVALLLLVSFVLLYVIVQAETLTPPTLGDVIQILKPSAKILADDGKNLVVMMDYGEASSQDSSITPETIFGEEYNQNEQVMTVGYEFCIMILTQNDIPVLTAYIPLDEDGNQILDQTVVMVSPAFMFQNMTPTAP